MSKHATKLKVFNEKGEHLILFIWKLNNDKNRYEKIEIIEGVNSISFSDNYELIICKEDNEVLKNK